MVALVGEVDKQNDNIARVNGTVSGHVVSVRQALDVLEQAAESSEGGLRRAHERIEGLEIMASSMFDSIVKAGLSPADDAMVQRARLAAEEIAAATEAAIAAGVDAYLTGEISEPQAHYARETGVAFYACGHHATERYGAPAVGAHIAEHFGVEHQFIDIENPA